MMSLDEATTAYIAARKLGALYNAYRAASRSHLLILARLADAIAADAKLPAAKRALAQQQLRREAALAQETDLVFGARAEQVKRRILELMDYTPR